MIKASGIRHHYSRDSRNFNFPSFECNASETLVILGESGIGKSTLLHVIGGLLRPVNGEVIINDQSIYQMKPRALDLFRGQNIGIIFQRNHFIQSLTSKQNLEFTLSLSKKKSTTSIDNLMERLNLSHIKDQAPNTLSSGEQQRLSIARAMIIGPRVILADEPTSALDDVNCDAVAQILQEESKLQESALIIVTHDQRLKEIFSNTLVLSKSIHQ